MSINKKVDSYFNINDMSDMRMNALMDESACQFVAIIHNRYEPDNLG